MKESSRPERVCRRPITPDEVPYLERFGQVLQKLCRQAGLKQVEVAGGAQLSASHFWKLTRGLRRTRASTIARIANVLAPEIGVDPKTLETKMLRAIGPALAPEADPAHRERIDRRRQERVAKARRKAFVKERDKRTKRYERQLARRRTEGEKA